MPYTFTDILTDIATENQPIYEARASEGVLPPRNISDALASVDIIISTAISLTRHANKNMVTQAEFAGAIATRFCQVWPFCR